MMPIPTKPVWLLIGRTSEGHVKALERYWTAEGAQAVLEQKSANGDDLTYSVSATESIIPDRTMPTELQRIEMGRFLHRAFVVLRYISHSRKNFEALEKLTDILHNFPIEMFDPDQWDLNSYIYALRKFEEDFPGLPITNIAAMLEDIRDNPQRTIPEIYADGRWRAKPAQEVSGGEEG